MKKSNRKSTSRRVNSTRGLTSAIRDFLAKNPGARYSKIASAMRKRFTFVGREQNRISASLSQLYKHEAVTRKGKPGFFEYYVRSTRR